MKDKIFEKIQEDSNKSLNHYLKMFNIIDSATEVKSGAPKKNIDFAIILSNLGLIELNPKTGKIIDDFHDYLFKFGIEIGVGIGKRDVINMIKDDAGTFEECLNINPEEIVKYKIEPTFVKDLKEVLQNE